MNTIEYVLSRMVLGDCEYVRRYLDKSAAAVLFLRGVEATIVRLKPNDPEDWEEEEKDEDGWITWTTVTGKTALHFASGEIHPDIVELLLERGADPNVREAEGHTPLSEAALWGRLENVKLLLNYGANPLLACIRDGKRALAVDFAKNDEVNAQKRDAISPMYMEDVERNLDRRAIVNLLEPLSGKEETSTHLAQNLAGFNSLGP